MLSSLPKFCAVVSAKSLPAEKLICITQSLFQRKLALQYLNQLILITHYKYTFSMKSLFLFLSIMFIIPMNIFGQTDPTSLSDYQIQIQKASDPIVLDGVLDEQSWLDADIADNFWQQFPIDKVKANSRTEVRVTYDNVNVYISAICYDVQDYVVQTLQRDKDFFNGDGFAVIIDPVNSRTNGFFFGVSPFNVQAEDLLGPIAANNLTMSWDNRWFSAVTRLPDKYIVEMAIPYKTLRFKKDISSWGINFIRNDMSQNQNYSWTPMPVNFQLWDLGYTGQMNWDKAPEKTGTNIALIPYVTGGAVQGRETETSVDVGLDAKVAVTSSLNLDLTINPDFSQVNVDVQQTNLTRFSLRFPEQRGFFLENDDLFTGVGTRMSKPIFTRKIGLDHNNDPVPIAYGARLSGNLNPTFRVGALNMKTRATDSSPAQNYSIGVFNQSLWARSVLRGYVTNRQAQTRTNGLDRDDYGRNAGLEMNYLNESGTWNYFGAINLSEKSGVEKMGTYSQVGVEHSGRKLRFRVTYMNIDSDYHADIGFIPRLENRDAANDTTYHIGYSNFMARVGYTIRPKVRGKIISHDMELRNTGNWYAGGELADREARFTYETRFRNTSRFTVVASDLETQLLFPTRFTDGDPLQPGSYRYPRINFSYRTDERTSFPFQAEFETGQFYNGNLSKYLLQLNFRKQPWGIFSLSWEQNNLKLPEPFGTSYLTLVNARSEVNFNTKVFWSTFVQYNTQRDNFNINSRLQWRYRTMSDLFIVYTYNYSTSPFIQVRRNQALMVKLNYMFNL